MIELKSYVLLALLSLKIRLNTLLERMAALDFESFALLDGLELMEDAGMKRALEFYFVAGLLDVKEELR